MARKDKLAAIADLAHRGANGALARPGRKPTVGEYKALLRQIRDLAAS